MAKWGHADFDNLKKFAKKIEQLDQKAMDEFSKSTVKNLAARLLMRVKRRTPVDTGDLKKSWSVSSVVKRKGEYRTAVVNRKRYASYVEYGHRQKRGLFIPKLKKSTKGGWVNGRYMMTTAAESLENDAPAIIEKRLIKFLGDVFNDK